MTLEGAVNDKVRVTRQTGDHALIKAKAGDADLDRAVATAVGWEKLSRPASPKPSAWLRPDKADLPALAARAWPELHRLGPVFLEAFKLRAVPPVASTLCARSNCCTMPPIAVTAAEPGRRACPSASCARPGVRRSWAPLQQLAALERRIWEARHVAAGAARSAARSRRHLGRRQSAMARRRGSAHPARVVHRHARGRAVACRRHALRLLRRTIWPSAAPCWTGGLRTCRPRPPPTRSRMSGSRAMI